MANQINVLLIEDSPGDTRLIQELLAQADGIPTCLLCVDRLSSGLQQIAEGGVDIVLLDLMLPDSQGFETFTRLRAQAEDLPVILITGLDDEELGMRAVREGAQDYLVKGSVTTRSLAHAVRFAVERHKPTGAGPEVRGKQEPGRALGFVGAKGGVGTTTVALNTAAILAKQKKSVIVIELRCYGGSFSPQTRQTPTRTLKPLLDLAQELITTAELNKCLVPLPCGAKALFAPQKPEEYTEIQPEQAKSIIRCAQQGAEYVVIDLPSLPCDLKAAVHLCDSITMVVEHNPACVAEGKLAVPLFAHWGVEPASVAAVLVIKEAMASFVSIPEAASSLGCPIAGVIPAAAELCAAATRVGTQLALLEPHSGAATSLTRLAEKLAAWTLPFPSPSAKLLSRVLKSYHDGNRAGAGAVAKFAPLSV